MKFEHLKPKHEFRYKEPSRDILDIFDNPGVGTVELICTEFTSLCPITGQPDYAEVLIRYYPKDLCIESKSLKLYLGSYRNVGAFAENLAARIAYDVSKVVRANCTVDITFRSRGGIIIHAVSRKEFKRD